MWCAVPASRARVACRASHPDTGAVLGHRSEDGEEVRKPQALLLMIEVLHDLMYQKSRNSGMIVYMGTRRICIISSIKLLTVPESQELHTAKGSLSNSQLAGAVSYMSGKATTLGLALKTLGWL